MVKDGKVVVYPVDIAWTRVVRVGENRMEVRSLMQSAIFGALMIELREWMDE